MIKVGGKYLYTFGEMHGPFNCEHLNEKGERHCNGRAWSIITDTEMELEPPTTVLRSGISLCPDHVKEELE